MKVGPLAPLCFSHAKTCRPTRRSHKQVKCAVLRPNTAHFGSKVCGSLGWNFACRQNQTVLTRNRAFLAHLANELGGGAQCPTFSCEKLGGASGPTYKWDTSQSRKASARMASTKPRLWDGGFFASVCSSSNMRLLRIVTCAMLAGSLN